MLDPGSVLIDGDDDRRRRPRRARSTPIPPPPAPRSSTPPGTPSCPACTTATCTRGCCGARPSRMSLWDWLEAYVDPAHKALTPEIAEAASLLAYTEGLRFGTTSVMDMWRFMEGSAQAADEHRHPGHARALRRRPARLRLLRDARDRTWRCSSRTAAPSDGRVRTWVGLEHLLYCSPEAFRRRRRHGRGVRHRHPHPFERSDLGGPGVAQAVRSPAHRGVLQPRHPRRAHGRGPLRLARRPRDRAARPDRHAAWPLPLLEHEALLGSGPDRRHAGRRHRTSASGQRRREGEQQPRPVRGDEVRVAARRRCRRSTRRPATRGTSSTWPPSTAPGRSGSTTVTGSLEAGKRADVVTVDLRQPHFTPLLHGPTSTWPPTWCSPPAGHDVDHVWVDGGGWWRAARCCRVDVADVMATGPGRGRGAVRPTRATSLAAHDANRPTPERRS